MTAFIDHGELGKSYLAGLFDGEGSINAIFSNGYPSVRVALCQKDKPFLESIRDIYVPRAKIYQSRTGDGSKGAYHLVINTNEDQLKFLCMIEPYVLIKHYEVSIAIQICNLIGTKGKKDADLKKLYIRERLVQMLIDAGEQRINTQNAEFAEDSKNFLEKRGQ